MHNIGFSTKIDFFRWYSILMQSLLFPSYSSIRDRKFNRKYCWYVETSIHLFFGFQTLVKKLIRNGKLSNFRSRGIFCWLYRSKKRKCSIETEIYSRSRHRNRLRIDFFCNIFVCFQEEITHENYLKNLHLKLVSLYSTEKIYHSQVTFKTCKLTWEKVESTKNNKLYEFERN